MARRKGAASQPLPDNWTVTDSAVINGRDVQAGTELSVRGERGRFRFLEHVVLDDGRAWINTLGGATGHETFRSFRPERVRTVHRIKRTRANA